MSDPNRTYSTEEQIQAIKKLSLQIREILADFDQSGGALTNNVLMGVLTHFMSDILRMQPDEMSVAIMIAGMHESVTNSTFVAAQAGIESMMKDAKKETCDGKCDGCDCGKDEEDEDNEGPDLDDFLKFGKPPGSDSIN